MLKSICFSILSLIGIISFGVCAFADAFQVEDANIIISRTFPGKYPHLCGTCLKMSSLSFDENIPLRKGLVKALNTKKKELLSSLLNERDISMLRIAPVQIEFIEKPPFLTPFCRKIESILDPLLWLKTPQQALRRTLMDNNYAVSVTICLQERIVSPSYVPPQEFLLYRIYPKEEYISPRGYFEYQ